MSDEPTLAPHEDEFWVRRDIDIAAIAASILDGTHPSVVARLGIPEPVAPVEVEC